MEDPTTTATITPAEGEDQADNVLEMKPVPPTHPNVLKNAAGEVIWDGDFDTALDVASERFSRVTAAKHRMKETNAEHQEAINNYNEEKADIIALGDALRERILVAGGVKDGAQMELDSGEDK